MTVTRSRASRTLLMLLVTAGLAGCSSAPEPREPKKAASSSPASRQLEEAAARVFRNEETHADAPPHGGVVVELGNHAAHAEVVLVPDSGEVIVHILDADGQPGKRIAQPTILADVETSGRAVRLEMSAVPLDGEQRGDASRFSAQSAELLRMGEGTITLRWILVDGQVYSDNVVTIGGA